MTHALIFYARMHGICKYLADIITKWKATYVNCKQNAKIFKKL